MDKRTQLVIKQMNIENMQKLKEITKPLKSKVYVF